MSYRGDSLPKKIVQAGLSRLGYKMVRLKDYERRDVPSVMPSGSDAKVFCIGFNKTATTSIEQILFELGYRMPKQLEQETVLADCLDGMGHQRLKDFLRDYDAFQDLPFSQGLTFVAADILCPGSKFILTLRDPEKWVESYIKYYRKDLDITDTVTTEDTFKDKLLYLEKGYIHRVMRQMLVEDVAGRPQVRWDLAFDRDFLKSVFQRHNHTVRRHFAQRPGDLLEIDVATEPDTGRLLRFLGRGDQIAKPFPHANKRA